MSTNRIVSSNPQLETPKSAHTPRTHSSSSPKDAPSSSSLPTRTNTSTIDPRHASAGPAQLQVAVLGVGSSTGTTSVQKRLLADDHSEPEIDSEERRKQRKRESSKKLYYENREENARKALERNKQRRARAEAGDIDAIEAQERQAANHRKAAARYREKNRAQLAAKESKRRKLNKAKKSAKDNGRQTQPEDLFSTDFDPDAILPAPPLEEVHSSFQPEQAMPQMDDPLEFDLRYGSSFSVVD